LENQESEFDHSSFDAFLEEVKEDYENCGSQFHIAFDKFTERYKAAKSKSIS